jgi:hypothetical protein
MAFKVSNNNNSSSSRWRDLTMETWCPDDF